MLEVFPEDRDLVVVARVGGRAGVGRRVVRDQRVVLVVDPLLHRRELTRLLDDLLRDRAPEVRAEPGQLRPEQPGEARRARGVQVARHAPLRLERLHVVRILERLRPDRRQLHRVKSPIPLRHVARAIQQRGCVLLAARPRPVPVPLVEVQRSGPLEVDVHAAPLDAVGGEQHLGEAALHPSVQPVRPGAPQRLLEGRVRLLDGSLHGVREAPELVRGEQRNVLLRAVREHQPVQ
mmetsp:Transcript_58341/g.96653  ORF Transcript_58341/g.96653 Transcript_58341/m.96653 type:complete len:235 (+) Transcript_58341:2386-3090(+)